PNDAMAPPGISIRGWLPVIVGCFSGQLLRKPRTGQQSRNRNAENTGMRILLTGDKGYIGAVMVPLLIREGHTVTGLDSDWFERSAFSELPAKIVSRKKDLRDLEPSDLEGFDAVIHLAGLSNDPLGDLNPSLTDEINHAASVQLAKLAKKAGVARFLFSSSCSTYGAAGPDELLDEQAEFRPVTPYGRSKVLVEQY